MEESVVPGRAGAAAEAGAGDGAGRGGAGLARGVATVGRGATGAGGAATGAGGAGAGGGAPASFRGSHCSGRFSPSRTSFATIGFCSRSMTGGGVRASAHAMSTTWPSAEAVRAGHSRSRRANALGTGRAVTARPPSPRGGARARGS